jgi:hypothetical protein
MKVFRSGVSIIPGSFGAMSYDLAFWKETCPHEKLSASDLYSRLADKEEIEGIADLKLAEIFASLNSAFPGLNRSNETCWDWSGDSQGEAGPQPAVISQEGNRGIRAWDLNAGAFVCYLYPKVLIVSFSGAQAEVLNIFEQVMSQFDCPAYDPQRDMRKRFNPAKPGIVYPLLLLTVEDETVKTSPTSGDFETAVKSMTAAGGPGFLILEGVGDNYVQAAGGDGAYTAEWRSYLDKRKFQHWVAAKSGVPTGPRVTIETNGGFVQVNECERLSATDVMTILSAYATRSTRPDKFSWREITSDFQQS